MQGEFAHSTDTVEEAIHHKRVDKESGNPTVANCRRETKKNSSKAEPFTPSTHRGG